MTAEFAGRTIERGEKVFTSMVVDCPHDRVEVPLFIAAGSEDGPTFCLISGEHGTELNGPETIRRFFEALDATAMRGTLVAVPIANPQAVRTKRHSFPYDKWAWFDPLNNFSDAWPGDPEGTPAECVAHRIYTELVARADAVASLHNTNYRPYMGHMPDDDRGRQLCLDYGRIASICASKRPGGLVKTAWKQLKTPAFLIEWPPLRWINPVAIAEGLVGLLNVLISLGMLDGTIRKILDQFLIDQVNTTPELMYADDDGVLVRERPWGAYLKKDDVIARVYDLYHYREIQVVRSPVEGLLVHTGPNPGHLATFFMQTDAVCKGELLAYIHSPEKHIVNDDGDAWEHTLMGGP